VVFTKTPRLDDILKEIYNAFGSVTVSVENVFVCVCLCVWIDEDYNFQLANSSATGKEGHVP
jgi:hypothetical protein